MDYYVVKPVGGDTPTPTPTGNGGDYQVVNSLAEVTSPKNGSLAYCAGHKNMYLNGKWYVVDDIIIVDKNNAENNIDTFNLYATLFEEGKISFAPMVKTEYENAVFVPQFFEGSREDGNIIFRAPVDFKAIIRLHSDGSVQMEWNEEDEYRFITNVDATNLVTSNMPYLTSQCNMWQIIKPEASDTESLTVNDDQDNIMFPSTPTTYTDEISIRVQFFKFAHNDTDEFFRYGPVSVDSYGMNWLDIHTPDENKRIRIDYFNAISKVFGETSSRPCMVILLAYYDDENILFVIADGLGNTYYSAKIWAGHFGNDAQLKLNIHNGTCVGFVNANDKTYLPDGRSFRVHGTSDEYATKDGERFTGGVKSVGLLDYNL